MTLKAALLATALLAPALLAPSGAARAEAPFSLDGTPGKLPKTVIPHAYRIEIAPDLVKLALAGHEDVDVEVRADTQTVTLNQAGLVVGRAALEDGTSATVEQDDKAQTATLRFPSAVSAGRHTLTIAWTGPIPETPSGIYHDDYKTADGEKKRMLVTQFEASDARRMFPGWDEPAFKATFQLTVELPKGLAAISNMPVERTADAGADKVRVEFQASPPMSTYLLALVAGDLAAVRGSAAGAQTAAWAPTGTEQQGSYALSAEDSILPFYNEYFGTPYPLPKLDLIAIPGNFEAGAMENWGAITFNDDDMLFDPKTSAPATREAIYYVVAHEMAHQWSGDLVTMGWWDNIWLNEGFATWMGWKATDRFNPSWEIWPRQHKDRERAMDQDAQPETHAIQQTVRDESEANSAFDQISYQKGEQIIRMVEDWIGPDVFRDGMRRYMKVHAYGNTTSADLWAALGQAARRDVAEVAASFTEQPGVPLVRVARACRDGQGEVTLTQDRFTVHDPAPKPTTWRVPVTLGAPGAQAQRALLTGEAVTLPIGACDAPVKANYGEDGYYRTQYDAASLQALAAVLPSLDPVDRANLLGDQFALFVAGRAELGDYLRLLPALGDERDVAVWQDTLSHLRKLDAALEGSPQREAFDEWAARFVRPELARLGWDAKPDESFLDALLRPELIAALGRFGDADTVAEAGRRFQAFRADPDALAPALREPVLGIVGRHADQATWDALREMGEKATSTEEKLRYFGAMQAAEDPKLMEQNVAFLDTGAAPNGRILLLLYEASLNSGKPDLLFKLVAPHEDALAARLPPDNPGPSPLAAAAAGSTSEATAEALKAAKSSSASNGAKIWTARVTGEIGAAAELRARAAPAAEAWLAAQR
jgi:aminopeptidase N